MIRKIATAAVYVEDQQKAKTFWTEKVGFELVREMSMGPGGSWLEVAPKGAETALVIYPRTMMKKLAGAEAFARIRMRRHRCYVSGDESERRSF